MELEYYSVSDEPGTVTPNGAIQRKHIRRSAPVNSISSLLIYVFTILYFYNGP